MLLVEELPVNTALLIQLYDVRYIQFRKRIKPNFFSSFKLSQNLGFNTVSSIWNTVNIVNNRQPYVYAKFVHMSGPVNSFTVPFSCFEWKNPRIYKPISVIHTGKFQDINFWSYMKNPLTFHIRDVGPNIFRWETEIYVPNLHYNSSLP